MAVQYVVCPHCALPLRKGAATCSSCEAIVIYGPPRFLLLLVLLPSVWFAVMAHRFFYDSMLVSMLLGGVVFGGVWTMLCMAFDDRVVFKRRVS